MVKHGVYITLFPSEEEREGPSHHLRGGSAQARLSFSFPMKREEEGEVSGNVMCKCVISLFNFK